MLLGGFRRFIYLGHYTYYISCDLLLMDLIFHPAPVFEVLDLPLSFSSPKKKKIRTVCRPSMIGWPASNEAVDGNWRVWCLLWTPRTLPNGKVCLAGA